MDDPFAFGQIVAANALSDVYAMGGKPLLVMNLVGFPVKELSGSVLKQMILGGLNKITEAGAVLVGGHSIEDKELKYGLSVTGLVHPDKVLLNSGARPGDKLLLTKPLGTGILATAIKGGIAGPDTEELITSVMATLNRQAAEAMVNTEVHGCTDITGFGLLGHAYEMALASKVAIRIESGSVPLLPDALNMASMGIVPVGAHKNREYYQEWVTCSLDEKSPPEMILYDPQTSGGLLVAAPQSSIDSIIHHLAECGYPLAVSVVGEVTGDEPCTITVT